jgi:hypothetical protein
MFLCVDVKNDLKNIYYFDIFPNEKYFKKQPLRHSKTFT